MKLSELFPPDQQVFPLEAQTLRSGVRLLFDRAILSGSVTDPARVWDRLAEERPEDLLVLDERAFIAHLRSDAVSHPTGVLGVSSKPICRQLGDAERQCARIVVLLLSSSRRAAEYLQTVGALGRYLAKAENCDAICGAESPSALAALLPTLRLEIPKQLLVRDIMNTNPRVTRPDAALRDAAREMITAPVSGLVVTDDERQVVGLLSEREFMRDLFINYLQGATLDRDTPATTGRRRVSDVMTRQVLCVSPDQPVSEVASIMAFKDVDRVPVVEDGILVGVLARGDLVRKITGH